MIKIDKLNDSTNIFINIVINILILFFIATGGVFIHYGNKIKDKQITKDDEKAGQFILVFGIMGLIINLITSILFGYKWTETSMIDRMLKLLFIVFNLASSVISIIYGLKIYTNNITADDIKAGEFIVTLGSMSVISGSISLLYFSGLVPKIISAVAKKTKA